MSIPINLVFEDELSEHVLKRLLMSFDKKYISGFSYNGRGSGYIKSKINGFNQACVTTPYLVLTDLDRHKCPIEIINSWFSGPLHKNMIFRIAIREVEAWLLSDANGFSGYIGISRSKIPRDPESIINPKEKLIALTRSSRRKKIKEDIVPKSNSARIGPNYNGRLMEFVYKHWDFYAAMQVSESLKRTYEKLDKFQYELQ